MNTLYYGDNLAVMRQHLADGIADLVYLDPPFNSNAAYNMFLTEKDGSRSEGQARVFKDSWHWDQTAAECYEDAVEAGSGVADAVRAFRKLLGESPMMAYISMMAPRLMELRRVLKPTGSIYLHCDPTASHYLKVVMDAIFGPVNFRNEIAWKRSHGHNSANRYGSDHDVILFYGKSPAVLWNQVYQEYDEDYTDKHYRHVDDHGRRYKHENPTGAGVSHGVTGQPWRGINPTAKGRHWAKSPEEMERLDAQGLIHWPDKPGAWPYMKLYLDEMPGVPCQDMWTDIDPINMMAKERLGYPTQKPEALLERIILASSSEGDLVLDPFCGCGTTVSVSQRLGRQWIGIDITHAALTLMKDRLLNTFGEDVHYRVIGEPTSLPDALALAESDPYQFQWWALGLVGARPAEEKKGADRGIDGRLFFHDEPTGGETKEIILSVKAGHTTVSHIRDLGHVVDREGAVIGVLITMQEPTGPMRAEAAGAGFYVHPLSGQRYPKLQILTVEDLLAKKLIERPYASFPTVTFKAAPVAKKARPEQSSMALDED